jgi:surface protein/VCBS repeat-containing protein
LFAGCDSGDTIISPPPEAPIAVNDNFTLIKNQVLDSNISSNDIIINDGGNIWQIKTEPEHGMLALRKDGTFSYTPDNDYTGEDQFTYNIKDNEKISDTATVTLRVNDGDAPFLMVVKTDNCRFDCTEDTQFEIPTTGTGYNYSVDCDNDGINETTGESGNYICNYDEPGTYTIAIRGDFPQVQFYDTNTTTKLLTVKQWGSRKWRSFEYAFLSCSSLEEINATDSPNLLNVTKMDGMFAYTNIFKGGISKWNTSHITTMSKMFYSAFQFNDNLNLWDTSHVTTMRFMFSFALGFNQNLNNWDTSNVTNMEMMFQDASAFNQDITDWNTSNVQYMDSMFQNASAFSNHDLSSWNITNVINHENFCDGWGSGNTPPGGWSCDQ